MKLIKLALLIAVVALFVVACQSSGNTNQTANTNNVGTPAASPTAAANTAPTPTADEFATVRPIYAEACARCHKPDGEGGQVEIRGKKLNVPSFKKGHALKHTDEEFAKQISEGGDGMPAFKDRLNQDQVNALVRFIRKEFQSDVAAPAKANSNMPKM